MTKLKILPIHDKLQTGRRDSNLRHIFNHCFYWSFIYFLSKHSEALTKIKYDGDFPTHAIHLWLEEEGEKSTLMYMVGEGETYLTASNFTDEIRELMRMEQ